jgi:hypothetical protein
MREKPWAAVPLLDQTKAVCWYEKDTDFYVNPKSDPNFDPNESYTLQYRPGRKGKVKK